MSNQPQAHVADDDRLTIGAPDPLAPNIIVSSTGARVAIVIDDEICKAMVDAYNGAARAAIPAGANGLSTLKPFAYCIIEGYDREYNTIDEFSSGRSNGVELYTAAQVQAILNERRAAGAPAETPKPYAYELWDGDDPKGREDSLLVFGPEDPAHAPGHSDHQGHVWVSMPLYAAQPAPAPATDARDAEILDFIEKEAIKGGTYRGITSANIIVNEGEWHELGLRAAIRAAMARAAMLSANSPREAG